MKNISNFKKFSNTLYSRVYENMRGETHQFLTSEDYLKELSDEGYLQQDAETILSDIRSDKNLYASWDGHTASQEETGDKFLIKIGVLSFLRSNGLISPKNYAAVWNEMREDMGSKRSAYSMHEPSFGIGDEEVSDEEILDYLRTKIAGKDLNMIRNEMRTGGVFKTSLTELVRKMGLEAGVEAFLRRHRFGNFRESEWD